MKGDREQVISDIIKWRTKDFLATNSIVKKLKEKYDYGPSFSYNLIREARTRIGDLYNKTNENVLEDALARMEEMIEIAKKYNNIKLALQIQQELNKVLELSKNEVKVDATISEIKINIIDPKKDLDE